MYAVSCIIMPAKPPDPEKAKTAAHKHRRFVELRVPENDEIPELPSLVSLGVFDFDDDGEPVVVTWHERAVDVWDQIWRSPLRAEIAGVDMDFVLRYVWQVHDFWMKPSMNKNRELASMGLYFGVSLKARRQLHVTLPKPPPKGAKPVAVSGESSGPRRVE